MRSVSAGASALTLLLLACRPTERELQERIQTAGHVPLRDARAGQYSEILHDISRIDSEADFRRARLVLQGLLRAPPAALDPAIADAVERTPIDGEFGELLCGEFVDRVLRDNSLRSRYKRDKTPILGCLSLSAPAEIDREW